MKSKGEIQTYLFNNDFDGLENYILEHSNLPGRMANLKVITEIADMFALKSELIRFWLKKLQEWNNLKVDGNCPETELVLTAIESFGAIYKDASQENKSEIEQTLAASLNDDRWRVREISGDSYKRIGMSSYDSLIILFDSMISKNPTPLEVRGIIATLAHPVILHSVQQLDFSKSILKFAFDYYLEIDEKKYSKADKEVLKKGLSFAPSVIVSNNPEDGFQIFEKLILRNNKEINAIIKENLRKKRLESRYPIEVKKLLLLI